MIAEPVFLDFRGYFRDANVNSVPRFSGIYTVYACRNNPQSNSVYLRALIYIGESDDVRSRLTYHKRKIDWKCYLQFGEELCYAVAPVFVGRQRAEAAMIYKHKPPANTEFKHAFPYEPTRVVVAGETALLTPSFTARAFTYADLLESYVETYRLHLQAAESLTYTSLLEREAEG